MLLVLWLCYVHVATSHQMYKNYILKHVQKGKGIKRWWEEDGEVGRRGQGGGKGCQEELRWYENVPTLHTECKHYVLYTCNNKLKLN